MFFGCRNNFIALMKLFLAKNQNRATKNKWRESSDNIE
jgi:amino acid permease